MAVKTKTVNFFRVMVLAPKTGDRVAEEIPWGKHLTTWGKKLMADQVITVRRAGGTTHEEVLFLPDLSKDLPVVTVHWAASPTFQTLISRASARVEDAAIAVDKGQELADSTAIAFLPKHNVFGVALGNQSSPRQGVVADFLTAALKPLPDGQRWVIRPIVDTGNVARFCEQTGGGVEAYEGTFSTAKDLLAPDDPAAGFLSAFDELADRLGSDLKITVRVSLDEAGRQRMGPKRKFRDEILKSMQRLVTGTRKAKVHTVNEDGTVEEIYNLIEERLSAKAIIDPDVSAGSRFSALVDEVVRVSNETRPHIEEILEG